MDRPFVFLLFLSLFLLPSIIAVKKKHPHKVPIILVNVFGGAMLGLGWIVALVWCFFGVERVEKAKSNSADEIEKLHLLKEKGILSSEEFESKKRELLKV